MNIMDLFRTTPVANPPAPQNQPPQNTPPTGNQNPGPMGGTQSTSQTAPNGVIPAMTNNDGMNENQNKEVTPFADFEKLWETDPNAQKSGDQPIFAGLDPAKIRESASKVNFAGSVTPEQLQKIQAGGQGAVEAFAAAMNSVAQSVYAQSALATTQIVEKALGKQKEQFDNNLPSAVKRLSVNDNLRAENPLFSNPAVAPLVSAIQEQTIRKFPNATPSEIKAMVNGYMSELGKAFNPQTAQSGSGNGNGQSQEEDWSKFFE